jgi:UDP-N-acetylmuramate--alanine ligase
MKSKIQRIHMVGIGGAGMSGIAEVLASLGYDVRGSDLADSAVCRRLQELGVRVFLGHRPEHVADAQVVVRSTAVRDENPEIVEARRRGIPIIPRAEMLAELMRLKTGVAVGGTHGKTTTTSLVATIFTEAGLDPTVIIGGRLNALGSNARLGAGEYLVAEADESDGSFLCLLPHIAVITNVDADHLDFYPNLGAIQDAFVEFANGVPFYGLVVACGDDPGVQAILSRIKRPVQTYGLSAAHHWQAEILEQGAGTRFRVLEKGTVWGEVYLAQPGRHNVLNALAAIAVAQEAGIAPEPICRALARFGGVGRRFERKGERDGVLVVDDYGHHPTEIAATLATARLAYPERRLVVAFQPHRFSRTKALFGDFARVFAGVDELLLTEIYPASEDPLPGVSGASLAQAIRQVTSTPVRFYDDLDALTKALPEVLRSGDVLLTLGAGSIGKIGQRYLEGK